MRKTKIVATLGPATDDPKVLAAILAAGVDVVRLNAAHAGPGELATRLAAVRDAEKTLGRHVGVLLDLPGPKLRVGDVATGTELVTGATFTLVGSECAGDASRACVSYSGLADDVSAGDRLLLDDGRIELEVVRTSGVEVETHVVVGGPLLSHKGVNVPGVTLGVEPITRYDRTVLAWAMANDVDYVGQSFVRSARDIDALREIMLQRSIPVVAKIEKHEAVGALEQIVATADAVMVARGDLGVETSPETVPVVQRRVIAAARACGRPVVIATQMLDSMTDSPRPTRAEASDVANAIFSRADACMLSGETAIGHFPLEAVETMARIAAAAETVVPHPHWEHGGEETASIQEAVSAAVCDLAADLSLAAIVPVTESGATALAVARQRPDTPIVAVTPLVATARRLALAWSVHTLVIEPAEDTDTLLEAAIGAVKAAGLAAPGERVALTAGRASRVPGATDFILVREL